MKRQELLGPVTEMSNDLTTEIDAASAADIIRILGAVDREIFGGCHHATYGALRPNMMDDDNLISLNRFETLMEAVLKRALHPDPALRTREGIVFAGCGTSGRVAFLCARGCNRVLEAAGLPPCFRYVMAAGDDALVLSIEAPEDDPEQGQLALEPLENEFSSMLVVGITCGLSAPFIAGLLHHAVMHPEKYMGGVALIGFNPPDLSRCTLIKGWGDRTCRTVFCGIANKCQAQMKCTPKDDEQPAVVLTPIVGGEAITGSTRMKGGSATKIMIDAATAIAVANARLDKFLLMNGAHNEPPLPPAHQLRHLLRAYEFAVVEPYRSLNLRQCIAAVATRAADTVKSNGRIVYAGLGADGAAGAIGIMDASEMVDTYGCVEDEWRALVHGGWGALRNQDGDRGATGNKLLEIDTAFVDKWLRKGDMLIILQLPGVSDSAEMDRLTGLASTAGASVAHLRVVRSGDAGAHAPPLSSSPLVASTELPEMNDVVLALKENTENGGSVVFDSLAEVVLKLMINAVSTAAQILRGSVYSNRMINITVSNNKLFYRTVELVQMFSQVNPAEATAALLRAIHRSDSLNETRDPTELSVAEVSSHVQVATAQRFVLPIAVLIASGRTTSVSESLERIAASVTLRRALSPDSEQASVDSDKFLRHPAMIEQRTPFKAAKPGFTVRNARPGDLAGAYYVCLKTGNFGDDGEPFYKDDPDALGRRYTGPYIVLEPELALILEDDSTSTVAGYVLGAFDSRIFYEKYQRIWLPEVTATIPQPTGDRDDWTRAQWMHFYYHNPEFFCPEPYEQYPAHMHIDLLEEARGGGVGRQMLEEAMSRLRQRGAAGVHLDVSDNNAKAMGFYRKLGFHDVVHVGEPPEATTYIGMVFKKI